MSDKSIDEIEEELSKAPSFIKPFLMIGTVITALACFPFIAIKILFTSQGGDDDA